MQIPGGKSTVTPYVAVRDASGFLDFVAGVFGAAEVGRVGNPDGSIGHAETVVGDSVIMVFDAPESWPETPAFLSVYVEDADETVARAIDAGGVLITPVADSGIVGDRVGRVRDPAGNIWRTSTRPPCGSASPTPRSWRSCKTRGGPWTPRCAAGRSRVDAARSFIDNRYIDKR